MLVKSNRSGDLQLYGGDLRYSFSNEETRTCLDIEPPENIVDYTGLRMESSVNTTRIIVLGDTEDDHSKYATIVATPSGEMQLWNGRIMQGHQDVRKTCGASPLEKVATYTAIDRTTPVLDTTQDPRVTNKGFTQVDGVSTLAFETTLEWMEQFSDNSSILVAWAHGETDALSYHQQTKGVRTLPSPRHLLLDTTTLTTSYTVDLSNDLKLSCAAMSSTALSITLEYKGLGWVGFGPTPQGMVHSRVVIGSQIESSRVPTTPPAPPSDPAAPVPHPNVSGIVLHDHP
jgi:hypothetical protein